ncbi:hypothetical protein [Paraburkholderia tropica]|uniref:hypothetical protein n=1 Tax=Paraburkholderia tropica TaxID=92647 RepID=UPI002AAFB84D|nr:hypothetical protein [Paraburkholderia tropica]
MNAPTLNEITDRSTRERPILFNGPMVRAILDGSKTQTRRIVRDQPPVDCGFVSTAVFNPTVIDRKGLEQPGPEIFGAYSEDGSWGCKCPHGAPGDLLWVRETHDVNRIGYEESWSNGRTYHAGIKYRADDGRADFEISENLYQDLSDSESQGWTPSIHMPRWASRITLEVTGVRVERLQAISEADAEAEGIDFLRQVPDCDETLTARDLFHCLWDAVTPKGADWAANPWVWVIDFQRKRVIGAA